LRFEVSVLSVEDLKAEFSKQFSCASVPLDELQDDWPKGTLTL